MRLVDNVKVSTKLWVGFGVVLGLLGSVGGLALMQASNARDVSQDLASIASQLHTGGELATSVNRLRANALAFLVDSSDKRAKSYAERAEDAHKALENANAMIKLPSVHEQVESIGKGIGQYTGLFDQIIKDRQQIESLYTGTMDPVGLKAADEFYQVAKASATGGDTATASACFEGVLEMNRTRVRVQRYLISKKPEDFTNAVKAAEKCRKVLEETAAAAKPEHKEHLENGLKQFDQYVATAKQVYDLSDGIETKRRETLDPLASTMSETCEKMSLTLRDEATGVQTAAASSIERSRVQTMGLAVFAAGFGLVAAFMITRSIGQPVKNITDRLKDIAQGEGDLTKRLDVSRKDEFGELSSWFNHFVQRIHAVIKDVANSTTVVNRASTEIAAASEEMAQSLSQQSSQTQQVSAAVEELSSTVAEVARKSEEASSAAGSAKHEAESGGKVVGGTISEMREISREVSTSASAVNELGKRSQQIGEIIEVINDIADQTNLLALNAAIEAARAGEHGRGFAVVADEVRKLAERTQKATEEVAKSIRDIQNETGSAVKLIESGVGRVSHGVELANSAGDALSKILTGSETVGTMVMSIASAATEQAAAAEEIARSVEQINASSVQAAEGAQQSARSAADLKSQATVLEKLVGTFKT